MHPVDYAIVYWPTSCGAVLIGLVGFSSFESQFAPARTTAALLSQRGHLRQRLGRRVLFFRWVSRISTLAPIRTNY